MFNPTALFLTLIVCSTFFLSPVFAADKGANKIFTIGIISTKPQKRIKSTTPLLNYIVARLPEYDSGKILVSESVDEMSDLLKSGQVSMLATTPYAALLIERQSGAKVAALRWKQGVESYHSVIFTRKDSNIDEVKDLLGHTITFEKDSSTSAFFVPSIYLLNQGFELQKMRSIQDKPDSDKIGYLFINDHLRKSNEINMSIWVFHKRLQAAAFSNFDWEEEDTTPVKAKEKLQIIAETPPFPRGIMVTSPTLSASSEQKLMDVLFDAEHHEKGISVMRSFQKTSRFAPIPAHLNEVLNTARKQLASHPELYK